MAKITPCMENGKAAIARSLANGLGFGSTEFHVLRSNGAVLPEFIYYFVRQESFRRVAEAEMTGSVGQKRVPLAFLKQSELPLPPLAEQERIVGKIQQLLACVKSSQQRLDRVSTILKRLRQAFVDAAVTGKLTAHWRRRSRMSASAKDDFKAMLASVNGQAKRRREVDQTEGHEMLTELVPDAWVTATLGDLFRFIDYRGKNPKKSASGKRLIGAKNIKMGYLSDDPVEYISEETYRFWMTQRFPKERRHFLCH